MTEFRSWGERVEEVPEHLDDPRLRALLRACEGDADYKVIELRLLPSTPQRVGIVVDAGDGTIEPKNAVGIRTRERLCLSYHPEAYLPADVRALRADFPELLHLNGVAAGEPASLCLYEDWSFEERRWTPERHLRRILWWLRKAAEGSLHADDQALEQLFYATGHTVVLPSEFQVQSADDLGSIYLSGIERPNGGFCLVASATKPEAPGPLIQPLMIDLPAVGHLPIQHAPKTLGELGEMMTQVGLDFQKALDEAIRRQFRSNQEESREDGPLLLIVRVPRVRDTAEERVDTLGFLTPTKFEEVGIKMGALFRPVPHGSAFIVDQLPIGGEAPSFDGHSQSVEIQLVAVVPMPNRVLARAISGVSQEGADFPGVVAGVGALGSVLADTWAREAWGTWTFIDPDEVAPHNLVRHIVSSGAVGLPKAQCVEVQLKRALGHDHAGARSIVARANDPEHQDVVAALTGAALLVDASTTIEVPRDWSERELPRAASVFLTYSGMSAVLLLEDNERHVRLASLEAQYYRAILTEPWGEDHLDRPERMRVGIGCRDRSFRLSYELVKLQAAQLARRVRKAVAHKEASVQLWTLDDASGGISADSVPISSVRSVTRGDWSVRWDEGLEKKLHIMRKAGLPVETGGVLVGITDLKLHTITVVDASAAPLDSVADATSFVRGVEGSYEYVSRCLRLTGSMVDYIGEWHAHPSGCSSRPSTTDAQLLATLADRLSADGLPALMMIVSEADVSISLDAAE